MEAVAVVAGVSKRTLYARFPGKAALLRAVVARLIERWLPPFDAGLADVDSLEPALLHAARQILATALAPQALALHRLVIAETGRFPELAQVLHEAGAGTGLDRIAELLNRAGVTDPVWVAEQFFHLVLTGPQRRALGLGPMPDGAALERWARQSVRLFLNGALAGSTCARNESANDITSRG